MQDVPLPQADVWVQFSIVAIVILAIVIIVGALYRFWRELLAYQAKQEEARAIERKQQDDQRIQERNLQREWEAEQARERDERWQAFLKQRDAQWQESDRRNAAVLEKLVQRIDELTISINSHDTFVRASGGNMDKPARRRNP